MEWSSYSREIIDTFALQKLFIGLCRILFKSKMGLKKEKEDIYILFYFNYFLLLFFISLCMIVTVIELILPVYARYVILAFFSGHMGIRKVQQLQVALIMDRFLSDLV